MPTIHSGNLYKHKPQLQRLYQLDFVAWYCDRWGGKESDIIWSLYPEYKDHDWDGTPDPLLKIATNLTDGISSAVHAATGVGKTWFESVMTFYHLDVFRDARIIVVGESEKGLERTFWEQELKPKFPQFKKLVPSAFSYKIMRIIGDQQDINEAEDVVNWQVKGIGVRKRQGEASAGALQGIHAPRFLILIDECAKVDPSVIAAAINTQSDPEHNLIFGFGNPDDQLDALYQLGEYPHVDRIRISALDFINYVLNRNVIRGAVTRESVAIREAKYGKDGTLYKSRVRGISAEDSKDTLLRQSVIKSRVNFKPTTNGQFAGVDVANSEQGDEGAVCYLKGNSISYLKSFKCPSANAIALNMLYEGEELEDFLTKDRKGRFLPEPFPDYELETIDEHNIHPGDVAVDIIGVGVGTAGEFRAQGKTIYGFIGGGTVMNDDDLFHLIEYDAEGRPLETYANKRTLAFYLTKKDFENGDLGFGPDIPKDQVEQAAKEGSAYRLVRSGTSKKVLQLESKDKTRERLLNRQSPNLFDAICQANFIRHLQGYGNMTGGDNAYSTDIPTQY